MLCIAEQKNPKAISSTRLRKHLATLTQMFCMSKNDVEQYVSFMGHTIGIRRHNYRFPNGVGEGDAYPYRYKGMTLSEIDVNLHIQKFSNNKNDTSSNSNMYKKLYRSHIPPYMFLNYVKYPKYL